ncbi:hypothetical protein BCT69_18860 [Enterovibrio norvegicus]|nr:hypothetical protein BCT69_18860 [Enterovibrio norvegicus]
MNEKIQQSGVFTTRLTTSIRKTIVARLKRLTVSNSLWGNFELAHEANSKVDIFELSVALGTAHFG